MSDQKDTHIKVTADNTQAKATLQEINELADTAQRKINQAFNAVQNNNGFVSNKAVAGAQNGVGDLYSLRGDLQNQLDQARSNQTPNQLSQTEAELTPKLDKIAQLLQQLHQANAGKMNAINNARTTSSRAFRSDINVGGFDYGTQNINDQIDMRSLRSDLNNWVSIMRRTGNNWREAQQAHSVSYNRYQEYKSAIANSKQRMYGFREQLDRNNTNGAYGSFYARYQQVQAEAKKASGVAGQAGATREQVAWARELDEQVKAMSKLNDKYQQMSAILDRGSQNLKGNGSLAGSINGANGVKVGTDPNSILGQLKQRGYFIARGGVAGAIAGTTAALASGTSLRLNSFDDIKSTAYANGGRDNMVQNRLGDVGFRWGYNGADMAQFQNAFTGSTGRTDNFSRNSGGGAAEAWARQSRVLGGANQESTLQLEQAAGNANGMSGSEMRRLGNDITNSIINSGMGAKASQQQAGLAQMYTNAAQYGASRSDLRNMAGFQASMSRYGSQFQGTQFAQQTQQMAQGLGNWQNPIARQMFGMGNPSRYQGVEGQARMEEDMQNLQKQPWKMRRVIQNAYRMSGNNKEIAAQTLSNVTGVPMATTKKWIDAANNGDMSQSQFEKYVRKTKRSGSQADQNFSKTGASKLLKYNASLADSAIKASHALDGFSSMLAKVMKHSGGVGATLTGFVGGGIASFAQNGMALMALSMLKGRNWRALKGIKNIRSMRDAKNVFRDFRNVKNASKEAGRFTKGVGKVFGLAKKIPGVGFVSRHLGGLKSLSKKIPFLDLAFAVGDLKGGHPLDAIAEFSGLGSFLSGSKFLHGIESSWKDAFHGQFSKMGYDAAKAWHRIPFLGKIFNPKNSRYYKDTIAKDRMRHMSVSEARRYAQKMNKARREGNSSIWRRAGQFMLRHKKGLAAAGVGSLALLGMSGVAHAATRKREASAKKRKNATTQSEDWKLLRGYNKMLDHAMRVVQAAKSIVSGDSKDKGDSGDVSGTSGKGEEAIKSVAKKMAKKFSLPEAYFQAQMDFESTHGTSKIATEGNNYGGIKFVGQKGAHSGSGSPEGDSYAYYDKLDDFANDYARILTNDGIHSGMSVDQFIGTLKSHGYMGADEGSYLAAVKSLMGKANGGMRFHRLGGSLLADRATQVGSQDVFAEAGTEAYTPLNAGHYADGLANLKDLAGIFGKQVVDQSALSSSKTTTVNPSYNINLTINGGTDDPDNLAQTVASKVREILSQYDQKQNQQMQHAYFANETSGLFV